MAKYVIWDRKSNVYTPSGEVFTAQEWLERYRWAGIPGAKMIVSGGVLNGALALEYEATKDFYVSQGMEIPAGASDEAVLELMEEWDGRTEESIPSAEERIASALEYQILASM
ncbi:MAG: hypothetical protein PHD67_09120 [Oscillospiraceae bacterium]|nr:hypothetical protein [Oscillospiraceae bacterium]